MLPRRSLLLLGAGAAIAATTITTHNNDATYPPALITIATTGQSYTPTHTACTPTIGAGGIPCPPTQLRGNDQVGAPGMNDGRGHPYP
jgi:hypothetical protein